MSHPSSDLQFALTVVLLWTFPVGAFVLRRRFADATGMARVAKWALDLAAGGSAPVALFFTAPHVLASLADLLANVREFWSGVG